jgi:cytochrome P450 family 110
LTSAGTEDAEDSVSKQAALPPGPRESRLRQLVRYSTNQIQFALDCQARYGNVFTTRLPGLPPIVNFATAEAARDIFTSPDGALNAGDSGIPFEFLIGKRGLMALDGATHKRDRKMMMPAVHGERLTGFGAEINHVAHEIIGKLRPGQSIALDSVMQEIMVQVILRTVFGLPGDHPLGAVLVEFLALGGRPELTMISVLREGDRFRRLLAREYARVVDRAESIGGPFKRLPLARLARCVRALEAILHDEIQARRQTAAGRKDVMSTLLNALDDTGQGLSDDEIRDEMMTLLVAGHETTATALCWATALCLEHPAVLANLRAEWAQVAGASDAIDPARVPELKYTDAVLRETLRLYPAGTGVLRRLKRPMRIGGLDLPAEVMVLPVTYLVHRDASLWPEPARFEPARFLERKPKPHEWFPFGGGARTCLGMAFALFEMKIVLPRLFQRLDLRLEGPLPRVSQKAFLLSPAEPIRVKVEALRSPLPAPESGAFCELNASSVGDTGARSA